MKIQKEKPNSKKPPFKHLLALNRQCRLLVSTMSERLPQERTQYQEISERLTSIIAEKVYEQGDEKKLYSLFEEETALIAELSSLHFRNLEAYAVLQEKSRKIFFKTLVNHADEGRLSVNETYPDYFSVPLRSLASLETILRIYEGTPDALLWKESVSQWLEIARQSEAWVCDAESTMAARGIFLANASDDFGATIMHPSKWNDGVLQGIKMRMDIFSSLGSALMQIAGGFLLIDRERICAKTAEVALQALSLADGLPKRKIEKVVSEAKKASKIVCQEDRERIGRAIDNLVCPQAISDITLN